MVHIIAKTQFSPRCLWQSLHIPHLLLRTLAGTAAYFLAPVERTVHNDDGPDGLEAGSVFIYSGPRQMNTNHTHLAQ